MSERFLRGLHRRGSFESLEQRQLMAADVVINEIMYHQATDDLGKEFIELYNAGSDPANLSGWQITSGVNYTLPNRVLAPGAYLAIAANLATFQTTYPAVTEVVGGWNGRLANRGESITLSDANGVIVDRVRYADQGDWGVRVLGPLDNGHRGWGWNATSDGDGFSLELRNASLPNEFGQNWVSSGLPGGTPGQQNSTASHDVAPLVADLRHAPTIPSSTDIVVVTAHIVDESIATVVANLFYRLDVLDTSFKQVGMRDDGVGADEVAGDGIFTATIPPAAHRSVIEFRVEVTDAGGHQRNVPAFESDDATRTANRLYQVLDGEPTVENWDPSQPPLTYLIMTEAERVALRDIGDGPLLEAQSDALMNGTYIRVDGNGVDVRYNVGVRNRGGASRVGPPNNYRVDIPHDTPLSGVVSLNLNSRFTHAQIVASAIYRLAGLPAAEGIPMQVRVNGQNLVEAGEPHMFGSYVQMETVTGSFPDRYFPEDRQGNLYRVIEFGTETGDLRYEGPSPSAYQDTYYKRTNEEDNDWSDLIDLVNVLNNAPEATFLQEVNRVLDVDQWLRYLALDALLGNLETGLNSGRGDNYWLYRGTIDTRFKIFPHDLDTVLGRGRVGQPNRSIFSYTATAGLERLLTNDEVVPRYYQAFVDLMEDIYNPETLFPLLDQLVGYLPDRELQGMKQFVVDRIAGVRAQIPDEFLVTSDLPIVQGFHRTTIPAAAVIGTANSLETKSVLINGQLADWSPKSREWSIQLESQGTAQQLVPLGSTWRYLDDGSDLLTWTSPNFDASRWRTGAAPLGYGEPNLGTVVGFGPNASDKFITTYFRQSFNVADVNQILDLSLQLQRDDGAIVYLNGNEVVRSNMPAGRIDFQTVASSWIGGSLESQLLSFSIDPKLLVNGANVLAVEIHQLSGLDDDLRFDLGLEATVGTVQGGVPLNPGVNRLVVEAFDGPQGTGNVVDTGYVDIWYDGASGVDPIVCGGLGNHGTPAPTILTGGTLTTDTVLAPCGPAYRVTGAVVVPEGVTLTILPGTTLFFQQDAGITFEGGRLVAEGEVNNQIRFTRAPEVTGSWKGLQFVNSMVDNRISHAVLEYSSTESGMVGLLSSEMVIDSVTFDHADLFRINTVNSSLVVRNSTFTDMFAPGTPPLTDNGSEHIKGSGIAVGGQLLLEGNYFGTTSGHNDSVDFDGAVRPGPIPIILNNYFAGSGDDILDLEADAHIEGNYFQNVRRDVFNTSTGDSNAISAGGGRDYVVARNTFYNVDHAVQVKDDAFLTFQHNTVAHVLISPIYFDLPDRTPGKGALVEDSIFADTPLIFGAADQAQILEVHRSIVTADAVDLGTGNLIGNARLADPIAGDFRLLPGSAAIGSAQGGIDRGAKVAAGLTISGEPYHVTGRTSARLNVSGPGMTQYRYRLVGGVWSGDISIAEPIVIGALGDGDYQVEVIGRNSGGVWQLESDAVRSASWTVDTAKPHVWISEVLASNDQAVVIDGQAPDLIEFYNDGPGVFDLSGTSLTDDVNDPTKYVFPTGTTIAPGEYLVVHASSTAGAGLRTGFRLSADGESLHWFDSVARGGQLLDAVTFGMQVTDLSISRLGHGLEWKLSQPTLGSENVLQSTGDVHQVRINEWLASGGVRFTGDFLELYNGDTVPVDLSGTFVTDDPIAQRQRHEIAPLSFIAANGFVTLEPNGNLQNGANQLPFGIGADGEMIAIFDSQLQPIDQVMVLSQTTDQSQGRGPDGSNLYIYPVVATPGRPNPITIVDVVALSPFDAVWSYDQSGADLGVAWRQNDFDASAWGTGVGPFGVGQQPPIAIGTPLQTGIVTHYFRREFDINAAVLESPNLAFELTAMIDDGAVLYVNGVEVVRLGLPSGPVTSTTTTNRSIGQATLEGPFVIPAELLVAGKNVITAELHQINARSSDAVFGASLSALVTSTDPDAANAGSLLQGLRVSELMYNPDGNGDAEYIELTNIGDIPLDLNGVQIAGGVDTTLSGATLAPGEFVVVVRNAATFRAQYGNDVRIVGVYSGGLSNGGEELILSLPAPFNGPFDGAIQRFTYSDTWYPTTDGAGSSLEARLLTANVANWNGAAGWRASDVGGSPGRPASGTAAPGDLNADGQLDIHDVDLVSSAIQAGSNDTRYDLNFDQVVNELDLSYLVEDLIGTRRGDGNLNGKVDFADFLVMASTFGQHDAVWSDGDFNADGTVDFADFLSLAAAFGYDASNG